MITPDSFRNKRVTVFGLGLNTGGIGSVMFLKSAGAREIIVTDIKQREELQPSLEKISGLKGVTLVLGQHRPEDFTHVDMVIKNPFISWTNEYIRLAQEHNVPVEMDSGVFFALCKTPIIGVTGTKGKTTTASLIAHIAEHSGRKVTRVGIGQIGVLSELVKANAGEIVVFELSSWRLSGLTRLEKSPHIAVITNIYPDHLNYYRSMQEYVADKKRIFAFQEAGDVLVENIDDPIIQSITQEARSRRCRYSLGRDVDGDGVWIRDDIIFTRMQEKEVPFLPLEKISLEGPHHRGNVLAAIGATLSLGLSADEVRQGIESFSGVPHRLETVAEIRGVQYVNDTTATIPEAAIAALRSFSRPVILIAGGSDKGLEYDALADEILLRAKHCIFLKGEATEKMLRTIRKKAPERVTGYTVFEDMPSVLGEASRLAHSGDIVLLSPGAASFGLFKNEFDRGEQFRTQVSALEAAAPV